MISTPNIHTNQFERVPNPEASQVENPVPLSQPQRINFQPTGQNLHWLVNPYVVCQVIPTEVIGKRRIIGTYMNRSVLIYVVRHSATNDMAVCVRNPDLEQ